MSNIAVDSSVVAKWILPEPDSVKAQEVVSRTLAAGAELVVLDLVFPEVANAIWKRQRQKLITPIEAAQCLALLEKIPVRVEAAVALLPLAFQIASKYDRAIYDALFVALARQKVIPGVTADEPLYNTTHSDFPELTLLSHW
jgi:predicted nucleic acid-binding protein